MKEIEVDRLVNGTLFREGAGVKLHRYIGLDNSNSFDPFLLLDYFDSNDPLDYIAGFPPHPHRGFETITYLLQGTISHEDNKGHKGAIGAGDVQWMTAGKGIIHSEMPTSTTGRLNGLQLWLNLPAAEKMREPRYQEIINAHLPLENQTSGAIVKVIAGATDKGTTSPIVDIATKPLFLDLNLPIGADYKQHIPNDYQAIVLVISGAVNIGKHSVKKGVLAALTEGDVITINATEQSQCLLIAAEKIREPVARYGPFVMNTQEEIQQALDDLRSNRF